MKKLTINHILCSNLAYLAHLVKSLKEADEVNGVGILFKSSSKEQKTYVRVDIVAGNGTLWMKVIARNSKALSDIARGHCSHGAKSILDHARCYAEVAKNNLCCFKIPKVAFNCRKSVVLYS